MKKTAKTAAALLALCLTAGMSVSYAAVAPSRSALLSDAALAASWVKLDSAKVAASAGADGFTAPQSLTKQDGGVLLNTGAGAQATLHVPSDGRYILALTYKTTTDAILDSTATVTFAEKSVETPIRALYRDATKTYATDRYGNELNADQTKLGEAVTEYVTDSGYVSALPYVFTAKAGDMPVDITTKDRPIVLRAVTLLRADGEIDASAYLAGVPGSQGGDFITIEGEDYALKSDSYIRSKSDTNPVVVPYSPYKKLLNALDESSSKKVGQKVLWSFSVEKAGLYSISLRYLQSFKNGQPSYRNIEIDGQTPYTQLESCAFPYTGLGYKNITLTKDGKDLQVYLTAGAHTIALQADATPIADDLAKVRAILEEISDIGLDLRQVAGPSPDQNRTWDIETYLPGVLKKLENDSAALKAIYADLAKQGDAKPSSCVNLTLAASAVDGALRHLDKLPLSLDTLCEGSGSVTQLLADLITGLSEQKLAVDRIYIHPAGAKLPGASASVFTSAANSVKRFFSAIFGKQGSYSVGTAEAGELNIWVNRSVQYVETMQAMADAKFTPKTGIRVRFSVMPSEQKIVLANATSTGPDAALGLMIQTPYQLALRGAVTDLSSFPDFASTLNGHYNTETLTPYVMGNGIYGATETQDFFVLMYRKDVLQKLGLSVPQTWSDVAAMMPTLRRNGMTFYLPLSSWTGVKPLYTTLPFFFQQGASLYSSDGFSTAINNEAGIQAFQTLTDLYTVYSVQNNVPNFYNNFRYAMPPIGIGNFTNYVQLRTAAPELQDSLGLALAPGTLRADGTIDRSETAAERACVILKSSKHQQESWTFLKWWLSTDVQVDFATTLQTRYGPEYMWNSANLDAFAQLDFPEADKKVILGQWKYEKEIPYNPASYMLERSLSDAWYSVVQSNVSPRIALNQAALDTNRELVWKLSEFGYADSLGNKLKDYPMLTPQKILGEVS